MLKIAHLLAGLIAILMTATFLTASVLVELFGTWELIVLVKNLIVSPGLFILALTIIVSGMTGLQLSHTRSGERVTAKQARWLLIAANSLMLSLPAALHLQHLAALGTFNTLFYLIQAVELWAGVVNLILMSLNIRDGLRLSGKI